MIHVERHAIEISNWPEMLEGRRARLKLLDTRPFPGNARQFRGYADLGQILLALLSLLDRESDEQFVAARALGQGYAGVLALGGAPAQSSVDLPLGDRRGAVGGTGPTSSTHATGWVDGWYGALMARDAESLDRLSAVADTTLQSSPTRTDAYHYAWKAALVAARSDEAGSAEHAAGSAEHAAEAIRLTEEPHRRIAGAAAGAADAATFAILPAIVERDAEAFQTALAHALKAHRALYAQVDPHGRDHVGFVAWGPLALACLAADCGMAVEVQSDYLLPRLVGASAA